MFVLHSWKSELETEKKLSELKATYNIPAICLLRDNKEKNCLKNLKSKFIEQGRPQKLINLTKK